ncbi:MAG: hypothetical protein ABIG39_07215 [Candidatus Micrarchaeota archaeon]
MLQKSPLKERSFRTDTSLPLGVHKRFPEPRNPFFDFHSGSRRFYRKSSVQTLDSRTDTCIENIAKIYLSRGKGISKGLDSLRFRLLTAEEMTSIRLRALQSIKNSLETIGSDGLKLLQEKTTGLILGNINFKWFSTYGLKKIDDILSFIHGSSYHARNVVSVASVVKAFELEPDKVRRALEHAEEERPFTSHFTEKLGPKPTIGELFAPIIDEHENVLQTLKPIIERYFAICGTGEPIGRGYDNNAFADEKYLPDEIKGVKVDVFCLADDAYFAIKALEKRGKSLANKILTPQKRLFTSNALWFLRANFEMAKVMGVETKTGELELSDRLRRMGFTKVNKTPDQMYRFEGSTTITTTFKAIAGRNDKSFVDVMKFLARFMHYFDLVNLQTGHDKRLGTRPIRPPK